MVEKTPNYRLLL